jgi:hypothetical protein
VLSLILNHLEAQTESARIWLEVGRGWKPAKSESRNKSETVEWARKDFPKRFKKRKYEKTLSIFFSLVSTLGNLVKAM